MRWLWGERVVSLPLRSECFGSAPSGGKRSPAMLLRLDGPNVNEVSIIGGEGLATDPNQSTAASDPRVPSCDPPEICADVTDIMGKIKKERGRSLFAFVADSIDADVCNEVYGWRKELREAAKKGLDVLIHSPGGDLSQCYIVARLITRCADTWEALVPELAASGATLICLGSSKIIMSEIAQLSPLDPQVISKRREKFFEGERQSPLEAFQAIRYLREFSLASLDAAMQLLRRRGVTPQRALESASTISTRMVEPIIGKIDPYDLGAFALDSRVALDYCVRISNPSNGAKGTQRRVDLCSLVETYPAHEFVIDLEEARALQFEVGYPAAEIDVLFDQLRPLLARTKTYLGVVT